MRKPYEKPGMYIENFTFSQSIATGGCGVPKEGTSFGRPGYATKETCSWDMGNVQVWYDNGAANCTFDPGDEFGGYCYHNPDGGITIFSNS